MQNRSSVKNRRPTDINQLAKSIVDLATGNSTVEDLPVELKKRPLGIGRRDKAKGNRASDLKSRENTRKSVRSVS